MTTSQDFNCKRRLLSPQFILFQKQTTNDVRLKKPSRTTLTGPALGKKYYGKKVIFIAKQTDLTLTLNNCKLLTRIKLDEDYLEASLLKSKGDKIISCNDILIKRSQLKKNLVVLSRSD